MFNPISVMHLQSVARQVLRDQLRSSGFAPHTLEIKDLAITDAFFREDGWLNVELTMTMTNGSESGQWFACKPKVFAELVGALPH